MERCSDVPSMRIAVTDACNLKCEYCPIDGDSYLVHGNCLTVEDFERIASNAYDVGFRHFSITGGEPLAVPDISLSLASHIRTFENISYLRLNTNGVYLRSYSGDIARLFDKVKVSIDSLEFGKYERKPTPVDEVVKGILDLKTRRVPVRINAVIGRRNIDELPDMIAFCELHGFELKIFDMTYYRQPISKDHMFWEKNYVSLIGVLESLEKKFVEPQIVYAVGGYGNPMPVFKPASESPIRVRCSETEARYTPECVRCPDYLCQDGFCNVTITADGNIKPCRPEGLPFVPSLVENGVLVSDEIIQSRLNTVIDLFHGTKKRQKTLREMIASWK